MAFSYELQTALQNIEGNVHHQTDISTRGYSRWRGRDGPKGLDTGLDVSVKECERTLAEVGREEDLSASCGLNGPVDSGGACCGMAPIRRGHDLDEAANLNPSAQQRQDDGFLPASLQVEDIAGIVEGDAALE